MIKAGMFVRCPIDREHPQNPRVFATGKVVSINDFNETAHIKFADPFGYKKYFEHIPEEVLEAPIEALDHCHLFKGSVVKYGRKMATIVDYKEKSEDFFDYYLLDKETKEYLCVGESELVTSFFSGSANPTNQLKKYEFQNPCWYLGRHIVKDTMNILDNSIFGFKELAGCKIYLKAFQLNTIMQCLQGDKCRYMLADEVGLGKTIEACSVLKIYLSNSANKKVLITVPETLIAQWRTELLFKFGLVEGQNEWENKITLIPVEELSVMEVQQKWDFVIVDEVHNYLNKMSTYDSIHDISVIAENIIVLSATPIQQRKEEYLRLLRVILPQKYDDITVDSFSILVEKQNKIARLTHSLLDEIDSFKNELLPEVEGDPREDEDVADELEEIEETLSDISNIIRDPILTKMVEMINLSSDDFGMYSIKVIISYICDNYQIERNIIRGRRAVLGVFPSDPYGEFSERKLVELTYSIDEESTYYEKEAYRNLMEWIISIQEELDEVSVLTIVEPLLEAFFSSPWAYESSLKVISIKTTLPEAMLKSAARWVEDENEVVNNLADVLDDIESHPSRLTKLIQYIDTELFGKKIVVFTDHLDTFSKYYNVLQEAFGEEVTGFSSILDKEEAEINIYKFQSDESCKILVCDKSGGEGRNLQVADYVVHVDLPWNINTIEQRIGRLDRMGREVEFPVTSVVIHSQNSYEEQLFKFWNEGINVFKQSLSGLEIIMNDINQKIIGSIKSDFEFGLYRLIPELIQEAEEMRETVRREQIFDTAALRFRPLYIELEKLLSNYEFNENKLFAETMMSWASLAGFGELNHIANSNLVSFDENNFSIRSARNSFLIPPNWDSYLAKKQNEAAIKVQRGIEEEKQKNISHNDRMVKGTFDRDIAIKNDYIHFYAPGDELFDCIVDNAMHSYRGMCAAFAAESSVDWKGFIYTYSIEPNERLLLDNGVSLYALGLFRQYLATSIQVVPVAFSAFSEISEKIVLAEHRRIAQMGYFNKSDTIDHLGRRGKEDGFLGIPSRFRASNLDWFKAQYNDERWEKLVDQSYNLSRKKAKERFVKESNLPGAKEMIEQVLSVKESRAKYFGSDSVDTLEELKRQYKMVYTSLAKPIIRIESASFMWLIKK
ncbi:SNF2-related protein [uncultured Robinsoniella sp.]|uniref:SNF2-related protein n=1 Tax=uncultured Robinsoniella sp. TaxID=904190 RepID=UPI00374FD69C